MYKLLEFLKQANGDYSSVRLIFLVWTLSVLTLWAGASIASGTLADIPASVITLLGLLAGAKTIQKFGE